MTDYFNNERLNSAALKKLIPLFINEVTQDLQHFSTAHKKGQFKLCLEVLHKMKGSSLSFGISVLANQCIKIHRLISDENISQTNLEVHRLEVIVQELTLESTKLT